MALKSFNTTTFAIVNIISDHKPLLVIFKKDVTTLS